VRILLLTAGSRGDVDPFVALGRHAAARGHEVRLGVTGEFAEQVRAAELDMAPLDGGFGDLIARQGVSPRAAYRSFRTEIRPMMAALLRSATRAAAAFGPDIVVHHPKVLSAPLAAARLGVPHVLVEIVPTVTPTRAFPAAGVTTVDLGRFNRLTYRAAAAGGAMFAGPLREIRSSLGLPARGGVPGPAATLVPISPALLPRPADWPDTTALTGPWRSDPAEASDDPELDRFLAGGDVLYAGFGSMAAGDPAVRGRAVVEAARAAGLRVLAATGWGGLVIPDFVVPDSYGDDVLVRRVVPHDAALPRCAVAVHHGGAGTVHAVVRAGVRSVTVPFIADQPFWGALLHRRRLGAPPVPVRRLTAERLRGALETLPPPDPVVAVAAAMEKEDGCAAALDVLERSR
jgi:sterol 3beta-glucosyltransferase